MTVRLKIFTNPLNSKKILGDVSLSYFLNKNNFFLFKKKLNIKKNKLIIFLNFIKKIRYVLKKPTHKKIIIFDNYSDIILKKYLFFYKTHTIRVRLEDINELYLNPKIIYFFIKNFFKFSIKVNYLIALIETINPKIIVCSIDNSKEFSLISLYFKNKINCVLFKNFPIINDKEFNSKELYFQKIFYFGKKIKNIDYKNKRLRFNYIPPIQSLYFSKNKKKNKSKYFTICLIDKNIPSTSDYSEKFKKNNLKREEDYFLLLDFLNKLSQKLKFKLLIAIKTQNKFELDYRSLNFKKYLTDASYLEFKRFNDIHSSYSLILKSDIVIGCDSSMLNFAFLLNKKAIMFSNKSSIKSIFLANNFAKINCNNYKSFEKKFFKIKNVNFDNYLKFSNIIKHKIFFNNFDFNSFKEEINKI